MSTERELTPGPTQFQFTDLSTHIQLNGVLLGKAYGMLVVYGLIVEGDYFNMIINWVFGI